MCIYVYLHIDRYVYTHICIYIHTCMMYIYICIHIYIYIHTHIHRETKGFELMSSSLGVESRNYGGGGEI